MASNNDNHKKKREYSSIKLFPNKKGVLGSVGTAIGNLISTIFHTLPKPILFIIFLAILLLIGQLLTYIFNFAGIYCNSADVPVSVGFNLLTTTELIGVVPDATEINTDDVPLTKIIGVSGEKGTSCSVYLTSGYYTLENGTTTNFTNQWFYDGTYCTNCIVAKIYNSSGNNKIIYPNVVLEDGLCLGNVYRMPDNEKGWWKKWGCNSDGTSSCEPPIHYRYDYITNTYVCEDFNGCSQITVGQKWDDTLKSKGAQVLYGDLNETIKPEYTGMIGIKCVDMRPRLSIWHIDIFDYRLWIVLMLIMILIWAFRMIHL
jgi:hypothetical protein